MEGIVAAIKTFYSPDKKISLYVFGDDLRRDATDPVLRAVAKINRKDQLGNRRVRIHAIGFPVQFDAPTIPASARRFAALMRRLCEENGGTFVGLKNYR